MMKSAIYGVAVLFYISYFVDTHPSQERMTRKSLKKSPRENMTSIQRSGIKSATKLKCSSENLWSMNQVMI